MKEDQQWLEERLEIAQQVNSVFQEMRAAVERGTSSQEGALDVIEIVKAAGFDVSENDLAERGIPRKIITHPFLSWEQWWPWKDLWALYMERNFPDATDFAPGGIGRVGGLGRAKIAEALLHRAAAAEMPSK